MVALYPILEEFVFRGLMRQTQIDFDLEQNGKETWGSKAKRMSINSVIFTMIHYDSRNSLRANIRMCPPLFASGIVFNGLIEATGSIASPIVAHSLSNFLSFRSIKR